MSLERVLPPGVGARAFDVALVALRAVVGEAHVIADAEGLVPYGRLMLPAEDFNHQPSGVVAPASVEEIQAILKICVHAQIPLWTVSTGRNFGYGSAAPATRGQLVLDLRRMNRILEVDAELGTALVEPGVTYQQLQDHLRAQGIPLWLDFPAPGPLVSPMGNTLERGGGLTPYGDHFANSCGMEVVLSDGTVLRTGMGGVKGTNTWQAFKYGYGPYLDGLFTQSNYGVVTKLGLWLMPAPPAHRTFMVQWHRDDDLARAIDTIRPLRLTNAIPNFGVLANATLVLTGPCRRADLYDGPGAIPQAVVEKAARERGLPPWVYLFSLYGRQEQIDLDTPFVTREFEKAGATVIPNIHDPMQSNELSLQTFSIFNWTGGGGLVWFSPVAPTRGADCVRQTQLARDVMGRYGIDFMTGMTINGRETLNVMPMVYDRSDAAKTLAARRCYHELIDVFAAAGYGFYRTGIGFMDHVAAVHGEANRAVAQRLKHALDPAGILAPGKSGIHP